MKNIIFILFALLNLTGFSQPREKTLYDRQLELCNVKSVESFILKYDDGKVIDSIFIEIKHFNESGFLMKKELPWRKEANRIIKYNYDEEGYLIRIDSLGLFNRGGFSYRDTMIYEKSEIFMMVAGQKKMLEKTSKIKGDTIEFQTKYRYNDSGQLIEEVHFSGKDHNSLKLRYYINYYYLECGTLEKKVSLNADNKVKSEHLRIYEFY